MPVSISEPEKLSGARPAPEQCHLLVFRPDNKKMVPIAKLLETLGRWVSGTSRASTDDDVHALLCAGDLECALADLGLGCSTVATVVDLIARSLVTRAPPAALDLQLANLKQEAEPWPQTISVNRPEGFCYYGLHPLAYAEKAAELVQNLQAPIAIVGIRSIGTSLSAIASAACGNKRVG